MPETSPKEFKSLTEKDEIFPVYFFWGDEKYLLKKSFKKLFSKISPKSFEQFNYNEFTDDSTVDEIADAALSLPFMADRKCVVVKDFNVESKNQSENAKLIELLEDLSESSVLIFVLNTLEVNMTKSAKWKEFFKLVNKKGVSVKFDEQESSDLTKFITNYCEKHDSFISKYHAGKILEYTGNDMTNLVNELEKLVSYAKNREISTDDIENLVTKNPDTTVFILIKAILNAETQKAYNLLNLLFTMKEEPVPILSRISDTYIDLYRVRAALESGKAFNAPMEYGNYKGREWKLKNAERNLRNLSHEKLRQCIYLLTNTDLKLKSSSANGKILLEELITKLLLIKQGKDVAL